MHAMALIGPLRGDKERPFTTCRELSMCRPELPDGYYYIDPNQGCAHDSIYVYCNFSAGGESCISPVQLRLHEKAQKNGQSVNHWNHEPNYIQKQIEYGNLSVVQLNFLRLHSVRAVQRVRYRYPAALSAPRVGMSLQGDDGIPLSFGHPAFYVQSDSCQGQIPAERVVQVEVGMKNLRALPLRHVTIFNQSTEDSIVVEPVCFL
uniref:collagen alpha-2(XI) chain-like n=1 Tax=Myxine glutinosa TaxID=7769 RepID=UPI00358F6C2D